MNEEMKIYGREFEDSRDKKWLVKWAITAAVLILIVGVALFIANRYSWKTEPDSKDALLADAGKYYKAVSEKNWKDAYKMEGFHVFKNRFKVEYQDYAVIMSKTFFDNELTYTIDEVSEYKNDKAVLLVKIKTKDWSRLEKMSWEYSTRLGHWIQGSFYALKELYPKDIRSILFVEDALEALKEDARDKGVYGLFFGAGDSYTDEFETDAPWRVEYTGDKPATVVILASQTFREIARCRLVSGTQRYFKEIDAVGSFKIRVETSCDWKLFIKKASL